MICLVSEAESLTRYAAVPEGTEGIRALVRTVYIREQPVFEGAEFKGLTHEKT